MALNKVEYDAITGKMNDIKNYTTEADACLKAVDALIDSSVGANGAAWSGESAVAFKNSWETLAANFTTFVESFNKQATNINTLLEKARAVDTSASGTVNE